VVGFRVKAASTLGVVRAKLRSPPGTAGFPDLPLPVEAIGPMRTPVVEERLEIVRLRGGDTRQDHGRVGDRAPAAPGPPTPCAHGHSVPPRGVAVEARGAEGAGRVAAAEGHDVVRRVRDARAAGQAQRAWPAQHGLAGDAVGRVAVDGVLVALRSAAWTPHREPRDGVQQSRQVMSVT